MRRKRDYKRDIHIDRDNLEKCWMEQASLMQYYTKLHADAIANRDLAKIHIDNTYAKLDARIRKNWKNYFESRPTETAIKSWVNNHKFFKNAQNSLIEANRTVNILAGVKSSFEHRKKALENLVSLKIFGFHSEPRIKQSRGDRIKQSVANKRRR